METNHVGQGEVRTLTRAQCREIDRRAVEEYGIPSIVLMENAGRGVADFLCAPPTPDMRRPHLESTATQAMAANVGPVVILCGKGNNAGDGFVIARHLEIRCVDVRVLLLANSDALQGDSRTNYEILSRIDVPIDSIVGLKGPESDPASNEIESALDRFGGGANWLVDAMLGTGAQGEPREPIKTAIKWMNAQSAKKLAVDIPSGLNCDTGEAANVCFRAEHTCTFVARKRGFDAKDAVHYTGEVHVLDIGAPRALIRSVAGVSGSTKR